MFISISLCIYLSIFHRTITLSPLLPSSSIFFFIFILSLHLSFLSRPRFILFSPHILLRPLASILFPSPLKSNLHDPFLSLSLPSSSPPLAHFLTLSLLTCPASPVLHSPLSLPLCVPDEGKGRKGSNVTLSTPNPRSIGHMKRGFVTSLFISLSPFFFILLLLSSSSPHLFLYLFIVFFIDSLHEKELRHFPFYCFISLSLYSLFSTFFPSLYSPFFFLPFFFFHFNPVPHPSLLH